MGRYSSNILQPASPSIASGYHDEEKKQEPRQSNLNDMLRTFASFFLRLAQAEPVEEDAKPADAKPADVESLRREA